MWAPGVSLLIWGWQLKREHFKCRDWSKSSPQTGEGRRVSKGKLISKTGWGAGAEERWVDVKIRGSRNQVNETHYDLLGMFNLKLWSLQLLKMVQLKGKQFHCDRAGRTLEMFDIQMPFLKKKNGLCSKVLVLHLVKCILIFLLSSWIAVCSVSSLWRQEGGIHRWKTEVYPPRLAPSTPTFHLGPRAWMRKQWGSLERRWRVNKRILECGS